jgi:hypothetical protein
MQAERSYDFYLHYSQKIEWLLVLYLRIIFLKFFPAALKLNYYRKFVLNMDSQPDHELDKIHSKLKDLCDKLKKQSGANWVNLDDISWFDQIGDRADDEGHPGIETNKLYYQQVINLSKSIGINL